MRRVFEHGVGDAVWARGLVRSQFLDGSFDLGGGDVAEEKLWWRVAVFIRCQFWYLLGGKEGLEQCKAFFLVTGDEWTSGVGRVYQRRYYCCVSEWMASGHYLVESPQRVSSGYLKPVVPHILFCLVNGGRVQVALAMVIRVYRVLWGVTKLVVRSAKLLDNSPHT